MASLRDPQHEDLLQLYGREERDKSTKEGCGFFDRRCVTWNRGPSPPRLLSSFFATLSTLSSSRLANSGAWLPLGLGRHLSSTFVAA